MQTSPHIIRMKPHPVEKVWGGQRLRTLFGKESATDGPLGESLEVADLDERQSMVDSGPLAGLPLRALSEGWEEALVGSRAPRPDRFPLLIKLLDAQDDLSVQVHPDGAMAERIDDADRKYETWLILDVDDGAEIVHGLSETGLSGDDLRGAVEEGSLDELLHRVSVQQGDIIDVTPGTIHAICAGVTLLEVQEPSDTTYRIYDYDRPGIDGQPRRLHIDRALETARLKPSKTVVRQSKSIDDGIDLVAKTPAYRIERLRCSDGGTVEWKVDPESPQVLHVLEGQMSVEDGIGAEVELAAYETAIVPAMLGSVRAEVSAGCTVVVAGLSVKRLVRGLQLGSTPALVR